MTLPPKEPLARFLKMYDGKDRYFMSIIWKDKKRPIFGLPISFTTYSFDEERVYIKTGLFTQNEDEVRMYRIMDLTLTSTLFDRMFGVGSIRCCSADKSQGDFEIRKVKKAREVKEQLSQLVEAQRDKKRVSNREFMADGDHDSDMEL